MRNSATKFAKLQMFNNAFDAPLLNNVPSPYVNDLEAFLQTSKLVNDCFSNETRNVLKSLREGRLKHWQFTDLPVTEAVPPTPTDYMPRIAKETVQSEVIIGAVSLELGHLFGYRETSEYVMYDIYPVRGYENSKSFVNSKKRLAFHTDGSAHPDLSPDFVILYCVRSDKDAINLVVDLDILIQKLHPNEVKTLEQTSFQHLISQKPERYHLKPILSSSSGQKNITYDEENVVGVNSEAEKARCALNEVMHALALEIPNEERSLLVINNKRSLHARTSFIPRFDGRDRWIKGAFVTKTDLPQGEMLQLPLETLRDRRFTETQEPELIE